MDAGLFAIIVLLACAVCGASVGRFFACSDGPRGLVVQSDGPRALVVFNATTGTTATVFLVWALQNTVTNDEFDGGCVSFSLALAASAYGLAEPTRWVYRMLAPAAFASVALNYIYVASDVGEALGSAFLLSPRRRPSSRGPVADSPRRRRGVAATRRGTSPRRRRGVAATRWIVPQVLRHRRGVLDARGGGGNVRRSAAAVREATRRRRRRG